MYTITTNKGSYQVEKIIALKDHLKRFYLLTVNKVGSVYNFYQDEILKIVNNGESVNISGLFDSL